MTGFFRRFKKVQTDRTKEYWAEAAKGSLEKTMDKICDGFDEETFATKKDSILFFLNIPLLSEYVVLDLACGIGRTCKWVAPKVNQYVGVDFIPEMIEKAKEYNKQYTNAKFYINDGSTLNIFENKMFDVVYCEIAFQHMDKTIQKSYVKDIHRILKDNGVFYAQIPRISFYNDESYAYKDEEINDLLKNFNVTYYDIENPAYKAYYVFKAEKTQ